MVVAGSREEALGFDMDRERLELSCCIITQLGATLSIPLQTLSLDVRSPIEHNSGSFDPAFGNLLTRAKDSSAVGLGC